MPNLPIPLLGQNVTAFTLTGQVVAADGGLTDDTLAGIQPLLLKWQDVEITHDPQVEEISAADSTRQHEVIIKESTRVRITQIALKQKPNGAAANDKASPLWHMANTYKYIKLTMTRGTETAEDVWTIYGRRGTFTERLEQGRCLQTLELGPADPGQAAAVLA